MTRILAFLLPSLLSANLATADDTPAALGEREAAIAREHESSTRARYHAQLTTIAERDIVTAQIVLEMAEQQRAVAVADNRRDDAARWARRHAEALKDERDARARAAYHARERDDARADFAASADRVRRLRPQTSG